MNDAIAQLGRDLETPVCPDAITLAGFADPTRARTLLPSSPRDSGRPEVR